MKAKVIIENGNSQIVLTFENEFEKDIIDKVYQYPNRYERTASFSSESETYSSSSRKNQKITIDITKIKEEQKVNYVQEQQIIYLVVNSKKGQINGAFDTRGKAENFIASSKSMIIQEIKVE